MNESSEIVVYRNDKSIVLYNQAGEIRDLSNEDINILEKESSDSNSCPFCGSILSGDKYNYVAKAYFYMLQNSFQNYNNRNSNYSNYTNNLNYFSDSQQSVDESYVNNGGNNQNIGHNNFNNNLKRNDSSSYLYSTYNKEFDDNKIIKNDIIEMPKNIPNYLLITGYYTRFFIERHKLGSGSYGHVYNCIHILDELMLGEYAVKKLPIGDDMDWLKMAIKEIKIRENIRHKNVVDYNHSWLEMYRINELCPYIPYLFILMEYCNGGNLYNYIQSVYNLVDKPKKILKSIDNDDKEENEKLYEFEDYLSDDEIMILFVDVLSGLDHLHKNFIIHRDLKPSNILLKFVNKNTTAMISDFGTCEIFSQKSSKSGFTGTIEYTAPELLINSVNRASHSTGDNLFESQGKEVFSAEASSSRYTNKVDMWSLGVVLYYISYGKIPFYSDDIKQCVKLIVESEFVVPNFPKRTKLIEDLIFNLLSKNSSDRMDCNDLLNFFEINKYLTNNEHNHQIRFSLYQRYIQKT